MLTLPQNKQPSITPISDKGQERYVLDGEYSYFWEAEGNKWRINVVRGFMYDGASVPRFIWTLLGILPDGVHRSAALIHDWLYRYQGLPPFGSFQKWNEEYRFWESIDYPWTREQCDKMFSNILGFFSVSTFRRKAMYKAVRVFGFGPWRNGKPSN